MRGRALLLLLAPWFCGPAPAGADLPLVAVETAARVSVDEAVTTTGSVHALRTARLYLAEDGRIRKLEVRPGDAVSAAAVLVETDDRALRAEHDQASARLRQAESTLGRTRALRGASVSSEDELVRAETNVEIARAELAALDYRLAETRLRAPFDGVVTERLAEPGDALARHSHVLSLLDPASLIIEAQLVELALPLIAVGTPATVRIDALGDALIEARVSRIHPLVDPGTRLGTIELTLAQHPPGLRAGQFARIRLRGRARDRMLVPFAALNGDAAGEYVFVVGSDDTVERRAVESGARIGERIDIVDGLAPGDRVVVRGLRGLRAGSRVKVADQP
ncbi:MAG: efflux RND transporter periplasmic adaptor subunit [Chromatiales bacterium]|nr:efflux RND transporter periplasmic adaptor subunit [Chromatiales bacterium]